MKRILIVDDSPATRALAAAALTGLQNLEIERVASGVEAVQLLTTTEISLVLTNVNMPDINGLELIRFIKSNSRFQKIPVIVMSTDAEPSMREQGFAIGADDYVAKPFTAEHIRQVINKYLSE